MLCCANFFYGAKRKGTKFRWVRMQSSRTGGCDVPFGSSRIVFQSFVGFATRLIWHSTSESIESFLFLISRALVSMESSPQKWDRKPLSFIRLQWVSFSKLMRCEFGKGVGSSIQTDCLKFVRCLYSFNSSYGMDLDVFPIWGWDDVSLMWSWYFYRWAHRGWQSWEYRYVRLRE